MFFTGTSSHEKIFDANVGDLFPTRLTDSLSLSLSLYYRKYLDVSVGKSPNSSRSYTRWDTAKTTKLAGDSTLALYGLLVQCEARKTAVEADFLALALSRGLLLTARRARESEQRDAGEHLDETER